MFIFRRIAGHGQLGGTFTFPTDENTNVSREKNWSNNDSYIKVTVGMLNTATADKKDVATDVFTKPMLFVPQKLIPWSTNGTAPKTKAQADNDHESYIEISCKIKQKNVYLFGDDTTFKTLYVPFNGDWEPGKRYVYTLIFGGGYDDQGQPILSPINFEADVTEWEDGTVTDPNFN